jgi:hypothetical protein
MKEKRERGNNFFREVGSKRLLTQLEEKLPQLFGQVKTMGGTRI